jgi:hypothetical protein
MQIHKERLWCYILCSTCQRSALTLHCYVLATETICVVIYTSSIFVTIKFHFSELNYLVLNTFSLLTSHFVWDQFFLPRLWFQSSSITFNFLSLQYPLGALASLRLSLKLLFNIRNMTSGHCLLQRCFSHRISYHRLSSSYKQQHSVWDCRLFWLSTFPVRHRDHPISTSSEHFPKSWRR